LAKKKIHIDNLFKEGLNGLEQPLVGSEWNRIHDELHPPANKRVLWLWVLFPLLLLAGGFLGYQAKNRVVGTPQNISNMNSSSVQNTESTELENSSIADDKKEKVEVGEWVNTQDDVKNARVVPRDIFDLKKVETTSTTSDSDRVLHFPKLFKLVPRFISRIGKGIYHIVPSVLEAVIHPPFKGPKIDDPRPSYYIGYTASGNWMNQKLSGGTTDYMRYRQLNESGQLKWAFGFELGRDWRGLDLQTGLEYLEKGQKLSKTITHQLYDSIPYIDLQGNVTYLRHNYRDTTIRRTSKNPTYRFVNVPFGLGKTFPVGDKYGVELGVKGQVQFLVQANGGGLSSSSNLIDINANQFNRINLNVGGYTGIKRKMNEQTEVVLRINWSNDINNMFSNGNQEQRFKTYGFGLSLRHKL
jgi:hypothetical protein